MCSVCVCVGGGCSVFNHACVYATHESVPQSSQGLYKLCVVFWLTDYNSRSIRGKFSMFTSSQQCSKWFHIPVFTLRLYRLNPVIAEHMSRGSSIPPVTQTIMCLHLSGDPYHTKHVCGCLVQTFSRRIWILGVGGERCFVSESYGRMAESMAWFECKIL